MAEAATGRLRITILGSGASPGVPRIGNDWGACDPAEPKNRRRRCSILIDRFGPESDAPTRILVDTGPDLREQMLSAAVTRLDGVLYTHAHADHTHGIDDLRSFWINNRMLVPVYTDDETQARLEEAFGYCFRTPPGGSYPPILARHRIAIGTTLTIDGPGGPLSILPFRQVHGAIDSLGFRIGGFAYSSDISDLPDESRGAVSGLDLWIVDALRYTRHPSHWSVEETLAAIEAFRPGRAVLTHMHGDLDYATLAARLPNGVEPGYDGMIVDLPYSF
ncbi:MBL fold metallo-hydrolase [Prosthecomicrobium pneumaticum]|uniref:Phosphoribosyl 1,2-cyclic phosphate phosphodiesterase n=1 Tax=Prosthecomicrobium pneumaticum TaxID=81895 RepID=A0A7W9CTB2_9HYPH|nr:MBL fold metallo-hydrolase [Prosthecomicrobium pneumaticum]MBB5751261.1 phosphoribosyl 1,2-cyclic phosphate phosphodiesterase [Prosthecomicrobium pneumaticum]